MQMRRIMVFLGAGALAMEELRQQSKAMIAGRPIEREVFPHQIAFNVIPQVDSFLDSGYTKEELKLQNEARRIMHLYPYSVSRSAVLATLHWAEYE